MKSCEPLSLDERITGVIVTEHAYEKARERLSLRQDSFFRLAVRAYNDGITHKETKGRLHRYLKKLWYKYKTANNMRIYGEYIYFFDQHVLITVCQVPFEFRKHLK